MTEQEHAEHRPMAFQFDCDLQLAAKAAVPRDFFNRTVLVRLKAEKPEKLDTKPGTVVELAGSRPHPTSTQPSRVYCFDQSGAIDYELATDALRCALSARAGGLQVSTEEAALETCQVVMLRVDGSWLIMDRDNRDLLRINGRQTRQWVLHDDDVALIGVGDRHAIFAGPLSPGLRRSVRPPQRQARREGSCEVDRALAVRCNSQSAYSDGQPLLIGSDRLCDLSIDDPNLAPLHALVWCGPTGVCIVPIVSGATRLDGNPLHQPVTLGSTQATLTCGLHEYPSPTFMVQLHVGGQAKPACEDAASLARQYRTFYLAALPETPTKGFRAPMCGSPLVLGRGRDSDIRVPDAACSRCHAELIPNGTLLSIRDLNSGNGTFVNDRRVRLETVRPGDFIQVGRSQFVVTYA